MKRKPLLYFFGGTIVIGTLVLVTSKLFEKKFVKHDEKLVNKIKLDNELSNYQTGTTFLKESLSDAKVDVVNSITERHNNAAIIIKDSLQNMNDDTEKNINRNDDEFDFMSNELKILSK